MIDRRGALFVALAAALWGTTGTAQALAPAASHPLSVGALRLLVGAAGLIAFVVLTRQARGLRALPLRATLVAGFGVAAYQATFFGAVKLTGVAVGTLVAIGSSPLFVWLLARERPRPAWFAATGVALVGLALLALSGGARVADALGVALALGAGASYALYAVACARMATPPDATMAGVFAVGAVLSAPVLLFTPVAWVMEPAGAIVILHLGLAAAAFAYILFGRGVRRIPLTTTGALTLVEPLTATLLAVSLLGETLPPLAWAGVGLLGVGLLALVRVGPPEPGR